MCRPTLHIEGLDLAGKTTACRGLAAALGGHWRIRRNSVCDRNRVYELAEELRKADRIGAAALGHLYVAALAADLEAYGAAAENTIQDSTIVLRSLAYHTVIGTPLVLAPLRDLLARHPRFTASVVLTANRDCRLRRLEQRQAQSPSEIASADLLLVSDPQRFFAIEFELVALAREHFDACVLDTSGMDESDVVEELRQLVASSIG